MKNTENTKVEEGEEQLEVSYIEGKSINQNNSFRKIFGNIY